MIQWKPFIYIYNMYTDKSFCFWTSPSTFCSVWKIESGFALADLFHFLNFINLLHLRCNEMPSNASEPCINYFLAVLCTICAVEYKSIGRAFSRSHLDIFKQKDCRSFRNIFEKGSRIEWRGCARNRLQLRCLFPLEGKWEEVGVVSVHWDPTEWEFYCWL